jgi:hypothetical protein
MSPIAEMIRSDVSVPAKHADILLVFLQDDINSFTTDLQKALAAIMGTRS